MLMNTTAALAVSASRTYSTRSNCIAGARAALGKKAQVNRDFTVSKVGERFSWAPIAKVEAPKSEAIKAAAAPAPVINLAALKGLSAAEVAGLTAMAAKMSDKDLAFQIDNAAKLGVPAAIFEAEQKLRAAKVDTTPDPKTGVPAFLKREDTPEAAAGRERTRRQIGAKGEPREIKNPPNAKTTKREVANLRPDGLRQNSKQAVMLDMVLRSGGATEAEICKKLGWKACLVTLRRTCERVGVELRREPGKDGAKSRFFGTIKSDAKGKRS